MAKLFTIILCSFFFITVINAQNISGEGDIVKQTITIEAIRGVNLGFSGQVILTQGNTQSIVLEGQQNILDIIKREVRDGVWNISFSKNVREAKDVTVHITVPTLEEVSLTGSGSIRSTNKFSKLGDIDIAVTGSGDITLEYDADETDLDISGSGEVNISGNSRKLSIAITGSGNVSATDLKTDICEVHISGSGDAAVHVNSDLETHISGSGDVKYKGAASVNAKITGSGEVSRIN